MCVYRRSFNVTADVTLNCLYRNLQYWSCVSTHPTFLHINKHDTKQHASILIYMYYQEYIDDGALDIMYSVLGNENFFIHVLYMVTLHDL